MKIRRFGYRISDPIGYALVWVGIAVVLLLQSAPLNAQWRGALPALSEQDIETIEETARTKMDGQPEGTVLSWENPTSGAHGTVTLVRRFSKDGNECRQLRHQFRVRGTEPWRVDVTICRFDGEWKWLEHRSYPQKPQ